MWGDPLLRYENKSCADTQQSFSRSPNKRPFPFIYAFRGSSCVQDGGSGGARRRVCAGVRVHVDVSEEAAVGLSRSPDALVWKL